MTNPYISTFPADPRSKFTDGDVNLYVNYEGAQSGWGAGDDNNLGISQSLPKKTLQNALQSCHAYFDFVGLSQTRVTINMAPNVADQQGIHFAPHALIGAQGGAALRILGGVNSSIHTTTTSAIQLYFIQAIELQNISILSDSANGLDLGYGARVILNSGVRFGACGVAHINLGKRAFIDILGDYDIDGPALYHLTNNKGDYSANNVLSTVNINADMAFSWFVLNDGTSMSDFGGITFNLHGHTVTGNRALAIGNSSIKTANGSNTFFPGSGGIAIYDYSVYY